MTTEPVPQLHCWRTFAVLAIWFFVTIIDLAIPSRCRRSA
jgi:hypothetical protein